MATMVPRSELSTSHEGFVFDPRSGMSYTCNPAGAQVLADIQSGRSDELAAHRLAATWGIPTEQALKDVAAFRQQLATCGLG
jgi:hypothetical protein